MARKSAKAVDNKTTKTPAKKAAPKAASTKSRSAPAAVGGSGKSLVIVESPKKAKAINKFLGSGFIVKASMGHVRDLPKRKLGLDVANGYAPSYEVMPAKKDTVRLVPGGMRRDQNE